MGNWIPNGGNNDNQNGLRKVKHVQNSESQITSRGEDELGVCTSIVTKNQNGTALKSLEGNPETCAKLEKDQKEHYEY
jgi:hypothetical protein